MAQFLPSLLAAFLSLCMMIPGLALVIAAVIIMRRPRSRGRRRKS